MINYKINSGPDSQLSADRMFGEYAIWWLQIRRQTQFKSWKENYEKTNGLKKIETIQEQCYPPSLCSDERATILDNWYDAKYNKLKQIDMELQGGLYSSRHFSGTVTEI